MVHEAEPGVGCIRRTQVVADALPRLIPLLFHEQPEATRLELGAVALNELLPRANRTRHQKVLQPHDMVSPWETAPYPRVASSALQDTFW